MAVNFQNANEPIIPTAGQEYVFTVEGLQALAANTLSVVGTRQSNDSSTPPLTIYVADSQLGSAIIPNAVRRQSQDNLRYVKLLKGDGTQCFLEVGNDIVVPTNTEKVNSPYGTTPVKINGIVVDFPVKGLSSTTTNGVTTTTIGSSSTPWTEGYITNLYGTGNVGSTSSPYANGYFTNLTVGGKAINSTKIDKVVNGDSTNTTKVFWRGDGNWANTLEGPLTLSTNSPQLNLGAYGGAYGTGGSAALWFNGTSGVTQTGEIADRLRSNKDFQAPKVYNAVFNDYAEYRTTIDLTPGHVVIDQDDGSLACTSARLQPGAQVISDTFGHAMGQTFEATTPIAVAGRVLVYPYQSRENYHAGMAVCSAPDGTVDIMTREEIRDYPDCIVGIVSEIPEYETWGSDNVKVDGRIWVRIK